MKPETAQKKKRPKRLLIGLLAAALVLAILAGVLIVVLQNNTVVGNSGLYFGPVTTFGVAPVNNNGAELQNEQITFEKFVPDNELDVNYRVNMEYRIKTQGATQFVVPALRTKAAVRRDGQMKIEDTNAAVMVDGKAVELSTLRNQAATADRPKISLGKSSKKSVATTLNEVVYTTNSSQMPNTYELLTRALIEHPDYDAYKITLDTKFAVYDVSKVPLRKADAKNKPASFTVEGSLSQPRFLMASHYRYDMVDASVEQKGSQSIARYTLDQPYEGYPESTCKWFVVPATSEDLTVKVGPSIIPKQVKTLREILTENMGLEQDVQQDYADMFKWFVAGAPEDGTIQALDTAIKTLSGGLNLYLFTIDEPGEHVITIQTEAYGTDEYNTVHQIQWADSPKKLWAKAGPRKLTVDTGEGRYTYDIPDTVFDFYKEKEPAVSSSQ